MNPTAQPVAMVGQSSRFNTATWWQITFLLLVTFWLYLSVLFRLALQWSTDANYSHGFLVPIFSGFVLWHDRKRLLELTPKPSSSGLWIMVCGLCLLVLGTLGSELFLARISFVVVLVSLIVLIWGWDHLRIALFPLCFLVLMIPLPEIVLNQITLPLQLVTSRLAAATLPIFGVPVLREGNIINLPSMSLEVADACSGIRSLFSLITMAVICGYTIRRRRALWAVLILAVIPLAIAANTVRIIGAGLLVQYWSPDKAEGFFHTFSGWIIFLVSLGLLLSLRQLLTSVGVRTGAHS